MKTLHSIFRTILLCALTFALFNCKKDKAVNPPKIWNYSTFTDSRDGKTYKYIKIGIQEWMAENLSYKTSSESWYYANSDEFAKYGRLYTWDAAMQAVPAGWHLPTDAEWKQLEMTLGMSQIHADTIDFRGTNEGAKLKSTSGWADNGNGTDEVGFTALPGGIHMNSGSFTTVVWQGYWWSATESSNETALIRLIVYHYSKICRNTSFKGDGISVRCVKD